MGRNVATSGEFRWPPTGRFPWPRTCVEVPEFAEIPECRAALEGAIAEARALAMAALECPLSIPSVLEPSACAVSRWPALGISQCTVVASSISLNPVLVSAEQEIREAGARLDRVLPVCGWDEESVLRMREMLSDEAMAEWVRLLTDEELRRFVELAAPEDEPAVA